MHEITLTECWSSELLIFIYFLLQVLFGAVLGLAMVMMCLKGFNGPWYRYMFRFVLLFSYIIPIRYALVTQYISYRACTNSCNMLLDRVFIMKVCPISMGNMFQDLLWLCEIADNTKRYI
jgi:hypothetical protein